MQLMSPLDTALGHHMELPLLFTYVLLPITFLLFFQATERGTGIEMQTLQSMQMYAKCKGSFIGKINPDFFVSCMGFSCKIMQNVS